MEASISVAVDFEQLLKYPRTPHLEGSRLQVGDEDCAQIPLASLAGAHVVIEEKVDGANCGLSFSDAGELLLQSRGHYLTGGGRERQFNLFKRWGEAHRDVFLERLEDRFIVYGEWMHKLHSVPYDALPHFFLEFDVWDRAQQAFLSTARRHELLAGLPILSVPVLYAGAAPGKLAQIRALVRPSQAKSGQWERAFEREADRSKVSRDYAWGMADKSSMSEGLYMKVETADHTVGRLKFVRPDFVQAILDSGKHHSEQPYIANSLKAGVDIFSPVLTHGW